VVDDEPRLRRVLVRLLEGEGFTCMEAGSGTEALELLQQERVPLVISDLRMPQMDGVTLLREIVARWPDTAVIVVTAVAEVESAVACLQLGALDYVAKPFHLDEVRARVMQALDKRRLTLEVEDYRRTLERRVQEQAPRAAPAGARERPAAPRAPRREGLSGRREGRRDPARSACGDGRRFVRRDDERATVPARALGGEGAPGARGRQGATVPHSRRRGLPRRLPRPGHAPRHQSRDPTAAPSQPGP